MKDDDLPATVDFVSQVIAQFISAARDRDQPHEILMEAAQQACDQLHLWQARLRAGGSDAAH